jgi:hypothetical protein
VFLVGGFGASKSLRSYLKAYIAGVSKEVGFEVKLITDEENS